MTKKQMIADIAKAIKEAVGTCGNYLVAHMTADRAARAAHSVIAGKVAELEAENARLSSAVCSGLLGELLTPDENAALVAFVKELRSAALAPYPERRHE